MSKTVYVIRVTNESGDDFGEHTFAAKPDEASLLTFLKKLSPGDWVLEDGLYQGPGVFGSYLHVEDGFEREVVSPAPHKSLAGPRGRRLRALCQEAKRAAKANDPDDHENDMVKLRYGELPMPRWVGYLENYSVTDIEAVLDALGVP